MKSITTALARYLPPARLDDAIQLLDESGLAKLELMASEVQAIADAATAGPITTKAEEGLAAELMTRGVIALKELDALRRRHVDPLNETVRAINACFKVVTEPCETLVGRGGRLEKLILVFRQAERARIAREQAEAQRKQEEAARREEEARRKAEAARSEPARQRALAEAEAASQAQAEAAIAAPPPPTKGVRTDSGSIAEREAWVFQVVNADQVPREYLKPDEVLIRKAVLSGVRQIAGVAITLEERLTRRVG